MLISVVVPSYNRADTVRETLDSILAQEVDADLEIIIGDDCSTDNAREVLLGYQERYPDIIRLIFHEQNMGLGANWATCIKACKGKYICNCDNDDYWHNPHKLQLQLDYMETHPESNICLTNFRMHNRSTNDIKEESSWIDPQMPLQQAFFKGHTSLCNATVMYRTDFIMNRLPLDDFIKYRFYLQDWTAWLILSAYTNFDLLPDSTATFGVETVSITRPDTYERLQDRMEKELGCYKYCCNMFPQLEFDEKGWYSYVDGLLLALACRKGDYRRAKQYARRLNNHSWKVRSAKTWLTFQLYLMINRLRRK